MEFKKSVASALHRGRPEPKTCFRPVFQKPDRYKTCIGPNRSPLRDSVFATKRLILRDLDGEPGWNRTTNLLIKSQLLCQLSYGPGRGSNNS